MAGNAEVLKPTTIILIGYSCVGKSTVARLLDAATGRGVVELGDVVRAEAASASPLDYADKVFAAGDLLRFATKAARIARQRSRFIVVGPRRPEELEYLRGRLSPSVAVALRVAPDVRNARRAQKLGIDRAAAEKTGLDRDKVEESWGLRQTIEQADFVIDGDRDAAIIVSDLAVRLATLQYAVANRRP